MYLSVMHPGSVFVLKALSAMIVSYSFRKTIIRYVRHTMNWFVGPFVCVGALLPTVDFNRLDYYPLRMHSALRALIGIMMSGVLMSYIWFNSYSMLYVAPLFLYGLRSFLKLIFPLGIKVKDSIYLLARRSYTILDDAMCVCIYKGKVLAGELDLDQYAHVLVHILGSADNVSTYIGRIWDESVGIDEDVCHILVEQPCMDSTDIYRRYSVLAHGFNLFVLSLPFHISSIGLLPCALAFTFALPFFYHTFSLRSYADKLQQVVGYVKQYKDDEDISVISYSLGGLSALMWRYYYDIEAKVKLILDRVPHPTKIDLFGQDHFFLPGTAMACVSFYLLSLFFAGSWCLSEIIIASLALPVTLGCFKSLRAGALRIWLEIIGSWVSMPALDNSDAYNVSQDQVLGETFLFPSHKVLFDGTHMDVPNYNFDKGSLNIEGYRKQDETSQHHMNTYEEVMGRMTNRVVPKRAAV